MKRRRVLGLVGIAMLVLMTVGAPAMAQEAVPDDGAYTALIFGDGVLALLYPTGWTVDDSAAEASTLVFLSDDSMLGRQADAPYAPGEASLTLTLLPTEDLSRYGLPNDSLTGALTGILNSLRAAGDPLSVTLPALIPAAGSQPEYARATLSLEDESDQALMLWAVSDDLWGLLVASAAPGELADLAVPAQVMLQSVQLDGTVQALRSGAADQGGAS